MLATIQLGRQHLMDGILDAIAFTQPTPNQVLTAPILIVGGSTAAYAAALGAVQAGGQVCLVQPQQVLGGQYTAQALPASDDGRLLRPRQYIPAQEHDPNQLHNAETFALSRTQRLFREQQRQLQPVAGTVVTNPGGSWVSHLSVTPVTAATALNTAILPWITAGQLTLIPFAEPIQVLFQDSPGAFRQVVGVVFQQTQTGEPFTVNATIVIEATDLGDLLELGNIESRVGQEAQATTGEAALPAEARPECQQAITFCGLVEYTPSNQGVPIGAPDGYDQQDWLNADNFTSTYWLKEADQWREAPFFDYDLGIFRYRRLYRRHLELSMDPQPGDVTVLNWGRSALGVDGGPPAPQPIYGDGNDYRFERLVGVSRADRQIHIQRARDRTQAYVHFLQTHGIAHLKPRGDLTWTADGIALEPYIREARRGVALTTVRHQDVATKFFPAGVARAHSFEDSVGIGQYHYLDFHPNHAAGHVDLGEEGGNILPFTIPLGALIPIRTDGLILSAKSIGTTHITNAAYRMHPVEWAIGEAGGHLAVFALTHGVVVREVGRDRTLRRQFQGHLTRTGIPIFWFNDISHDDPDFEAIQVLAAAAIIRTENAQTLNFNPEGRVNRAVVAVAFGNIMGLEVVPPSIPTFSDVPPDHFAFASIEALFAQGIIRGVGNGQFAPEQPFTRLQLAVLLDAVAPTLDRSQLAIRFDAQVLKRRELSRALYALMQNTWGEN